MAHELDTTDGTTPFAAREDAWNRPGTTVGEAMNADQALELANLAGWNVRKLPLTATEPVMNEDGVTDTRLDVPGHFATVRTNPVNGRTDVLGVVGNQYVPVQNEDNVELLNALVDESGAHFETAGALRGGREVFVTMQFPDHMNIGGVDPVSLNIAALNSHDGTSAFKFVVTPVRIVCANTQAAALNQAKASFSARHTRNIRQVVTQAREALDMTFKYVEAFEAEAERLIQEEMTNGQFEALIDSLWAAPDEDSKTKTSAQSRRRRETLRGLFTDSYTNKEIRGTRWAGYQAITEYVDHYAPVFAKGADVADVRAARALSSDADALKRRAFRAVAV